MKRLTKSDLKTLVSHGSSTCLSVYIPVASADSFFHQNRIRFKNILQKAAEALKEQAPGCDSDSFLGPLAHELKNLTPQTMNHCEGAALFRSSDGYFAAFSVPIAFRETTHIGPMFLIEPLAELASKTVHYGLLCLSKDKVRLFVCTQFECAPFPLAYENRIHNKTDESKARQFRSQGRSNSVYFGHNDDNLEDSLVIDFYRAIQNEISSSPALQNLPIVFAGSAQARELFRECKSSFKFIEDDVDADPFASDFNGLLRRGFEALEAVRVKQTQKDLERFQTLKKTHRASFNLFEILQMSANGAIDTLFLPEREGEADPHFKHSIFDVGNHLIQQKAEIVNRAVNETLRFDGKIATLPADSSDFIEPLPVAIFRFPLPNTN